MKTYQRTLLVGFVGAALVGVVASVGFAWESTLIPQPTWFDTMVKDGDDAQAIKRKLCRDKEGRMEKALAKAVKFAEADLAKRPKNFVGPSYGQLVRKYFVMSLDNPQFMDDDFDPRKNDGVN